MIRVWISPDGEWQQYATRSKFAHMELAIKLLQHEIITGRIDPEEYGPPSQTESEALISNGWVRYSGGFVDGRPEYISKNWSVIRSLIQSDILQFGMKMSIFFDIRDEHGRVVRSFQTTLGDADEPQPPSHVFRESILTGFRRRPQATLPVRVTRYRRRRRRG